MISNIAINYGNFIAIFDLTGNNGRRKFEFKGLQDRRISNIAIIIRGRSHPGLGSISETRDWSHPDAFETGKSRV
jgi:hypothetical protein